MGEIEADCAGCWHRRHPPCLRPEGLAPWRWLSGAAACPSFGHAMGGMAKPADLLRCLEVALGIDQEVGGDYHSLAIFDTSSTST